MKKTAEIPTKVLRKVKIAHIPVVEENGEIDSLQFAEINGILLIPVTDAHLFNTSASSIRRLIRQGKLKAYHGNGQLKRDSRSTKVYFDLNKYLTLHNN